MKKHSIQKSPLKMYLAMFAFVLSIQQLSAQEICLGSRNQITGDVGGYHHELWNPTTGADECMTLNSGATFSGKWSNAQDYLARRGLYYGSNTGKTYKDRGGIQFKYTVDWKAQYVEGGNSSIGMYGWVHRVNNKGTTAEYYVVENWLTWNHGKDSTAQSLGAIFVNDQKYEVIKTTRKGQPTPWGNQDFVQYVSVRLNMDSDDKNVPPKPLGVIGGTINLTQHFAAWEKLGLDMSGELYEATFLAEGYKSTGTFNVSQLEITTNMPSPTSIGLSSSAYTMNVDGQTLLQWGYGPNDVISGTAVILSTSSDRACNNVDLWAYKGKWIMSAMSPGSCTLTILSPDGLKSGTATVTVQPGVAPLRLAEYRAMGTTGGEQIYLLRDGKRFNQGRTLTTSFQTFTDAVYGDGEISVEFVNDDVISGGRDVRVDYIAIDGIKRETEAMAINTGAYGNGKCGGGAYTEWLNCSGSVKFGQLKQEHTITVRARGNVGGEHLLLLINGQSVNSGWNLGTGFQEYIINVMGDGDINVKYDNDGGLRDAIVDWVKVDNQNPRQAENMQYNTAAFAGGRCGGGSFSEWMHCNGVIGFGKISDNFN